MKLARDLSLLTFVVTLSSAAHAAAIAVPVPELDASVACNAMMLVAGAVLIIRGREKK